MVFHRGDDADSFYVVRRGRAVIEDDDPDTGDTRVISTLTRGDSFGELGLLKNCRDADGHTYGAQENYEAIIASGARLVATAAVASKVRPSSARCWSACSADH